MSYQDGSWRPLAPKEALERVLEGLRQVEPPPQFEAVVLSAIQRKLAIATAPTSLLSSRLLRSLFPVAGAIAFVVACLVIPVLRQTLSRRDTPKTTSMDVAITATLSRSTEGKRARDDRAGSHVPGQTRQNNAQVTLDRSINVVHPSTPAFAPATTPPWDSLSAAELAKLEAIAASQPEPPLPITNEERQIQRFIERHSTYQLAALDPRAEPLHESVERDEFRRFFAPPPEPSGNLPLAPVEPPATAELIDQN